MPKPPSLPHKVIVDFILSGNTTRDAKKHFRFKTDNVANLRVHAAFKALGIPRPRYAKSRRCEYCGSVFLARDFKQGTCGSPACQRSMILDWHTKNPESGREALQKYRSTEKGRQNNLRMHRRRRERSGWFGPRALELRSIRDQKEFAQASVSRFSESVGVPLGTRAESCAVRTRLHASESQKH